MARTPSVGGILDVRSIGVLFEQSKTLCGSSPASETARRVVYEENTLMCDRTGLPSKEYPCSECGCCKNGVPYNGSGSIFGEAWTPLGRSCCAESSRTFGSDRPCIGAIRRDYVSKNRSGFAGNVELGDEGQAGKFDRTRDWAIAFGTSIIIASVVGLVQSYAVFIPAIQAHYTIGVMEAVLIGCLCYMVLILFLPFSIIITKCVGNRWAAVFGMVLFFLGICLDALVIHICTLYVSHVVLMGIGGSIAYGATVSINSDHFRRYLRHAYCLSLCAPCLGTIIFYYLSSLMLNYVSYQWTKFCLALIFLLCTAACQTLPRKPRDFQWNAGNAGHARINQCVKHCINDGRDPCPSEELAEKKSYMCICVCDVSCWTDYSFLLWAVLSMLALIGIFVPYLFLMAYALSIGTDYSLAILCWYCIASMGTRIILILDDLETFIFYRSAFQLACIGSGIMYIVLVWIDTFGWTVVWSLVAGAVEGILVVCIPILTLRTCPMKSVGAYWSWVVVFHAFAIIIGPMVIMSVYDHLPRLIGWSRKRQALISKNQVILPTNFRKRIFNALCSYNTEEYGPGYIAIGVTQIIAGLFAILLPNEDEDYGGSPARDTSREIAADYSAGTGRAPFMIARSDAYKYSSSAYSSFGYERSGTGGTYPKNTAFTGYGFYDAPYQAYTSCKCKGIDSSQYKSKGRGRKEMSTSSSDEIKKKRCCSSSCCSKSKKDQVKSPKKEKEKNRHKDKKSKVKDKKEDKGKKDKDTEKDKKDKDKNREKDKDTKDTDRDKSREKDRRGKRGNKEEDSEEVSETKTKDRHNKADKDSKDRKDHKEPKDHHRDHKDKSKDHKELKDHHREDKNHKNKEKHKDKHKRGKDKEEADLEED